MKNIKFLLFGILLTFLLIPNVYAKNNVEIKSITQADISENTIEKSPPTHNGLEMNFDISFKQKDDFIKYKVIIKNETNVDYNISNDTSFNKSEFITYSYETTGVLKANSETIVYVTITYTNEVDPSLMVNGIYPEQNKAVIKLLDKDGNPPNPNTGINTYIIITFLLLSLLLLTILLNKNKKSKILMILLISLFIIPSMVYAIETLKLTINVKVEIKKAYKVGYIFNEDLVYTESELEQYDTSVATCDKTFYLGEKTPENKYIECKNVLYEDNKLYSAGEIVNTNTSLTGLKRLIEKDSQSNPNIEYCQEESTGIYLCDDRATLEDHPFYTWSYYNNVNTSDGYISYSSDIMTMNFSNITQNNWSTHSPDITVSRNGTFTMPNHNVLFFMNGIAR